ncbi:restriction endonuclease [Streptosporangium sp. NPDC051022]|uniref:restriction endonuclease n=1 Tax=Streptosporangium sp. NPDC051022 TaxID=3155752 RepID=UPI0034498BFD
MATTVESAIPDIQEQVLEELIQSEFRSAPASTRQARNSLLAAGLIYRSRMNHWGATEGARQWLESNDTIDLVALVHSSVWFVGELLRELEEADRSASDLAKLSSLYSRDPLNPQAVSVRLRFLLDADVVEKVSNQKFRLTPVGRGLIEILPLEDRAQVTIIAADEGTNQARPAATRSSPAVKLADLLARDSRDGTKHKQVEQLVCEAFRFLGFEVQPIGGPGKTDAIICSTSAALPPIAIEVKTASAGPVPPSELRAVKLERHREKVGAIATVAIGPEFHADTHSEASKNHGFALMHTETLGRLLLLHEQFPFSTEEIRRFLDPELTVKQRHEIVESSWTARVHQLNALKAVLGRLVAEQRAPYGDGLLKERDVQRDLRDLDPDLVSNALHLLSSPFLSALSGADREQFKPTAAIGLVAQRLQAISKWITDNDES